MIKLQAKFSGTPVLLVNEKTPKDFIEFWNGKTIGTSGNPLDIKVEPKSNLIHLGYKEEITGEDFHGTPVMERYKTRTILYLHADTGLGLLPTKVNQEAPLLSVAWNTGTKEIHTHFVEDEKLLEAVRAHGVNVVLHGAAAKGTEPKPEPEEKQVFKPASGPAKKKRGRKAAKR